MGTLLSKAGWSDHNLDKADLRYCGPKAARIFCFDFSRRDLGVITPGGGLLHASELRPISKHCVLGGVGVYRSLRVKVDNDHLRRRRHDVTALGRETNDIWSRIFNDKRRVALPFF
jgi:hypothetical protein